MRRRLVLTTAVLTFALAPPAVAGTYTVTACMENPNEGAPGNGSWAGEAFDPFVTTSTSCPGAGIVTRLNLGAGNAWHGASARNSFTAPAGNRIIGITADMQFNATRGWYAGLLDGASWITCATNCSSLGQWVRHSYATNAPQLFAQVTCGASGGCPHYAQDGYFAMKNVRITVADDNAPSVAITGGSVTQPGWHAGDQTVQIAASDASGIVTTEVFVNGMFTTT